MKDRAPRLQDLLVEHQLTTRAKINEALFASGTNSVLGALETTLPSEEFRCLLKELGNKLNLPVPDFSPRSIDRNLDRRDPAQFKQLVELHRSIPFMHINENGSSELDLAVTDPLNAAQITDWGRLYGATVRTSLISDSDFQKYCLVLFSKLPIGERPTIDPLSVNTPQRSNCDPEIEQIVGDLILAAARRGLSSVILEDIAGVTRVRAQVGARDVEWRIPIVFNRAVSWLRSISATQSNHSYLATMSAGEIDVRFAIEESNGLLVINNPRFCLDVDSELEVGPSDGNNHVAIIVASDLETGSTNCWERLKGGAGVKLSRNRSDTLLSALLDQPRIIVVDYAFPELNAPELLKNLTANATQAEVLVVLPEEKLNLSPDLEQAGADACIKLNDLEDRIRAYLKE